MSVLGRVGLRFSLEADSFGLVSVKLCGETHTGPCVLLLLGGGELALTEQASRSCSLLVALSSSPDAISVPPFSYQHVFTDVYVFSSFLPFLF